MLPEPRCPVDKACGHQGANRLQAQACQASWKTILGGRHYSGSSVQRGEARPGMGDRYHVHSRPGGLCLYGRRDRSIFPPCGGLIDAKPTDHRWCAAGTEHGSMAAQTNALGADPLGSRLAVHQHGLGCLRPRPRDSRPTLPSNAREQDGVGVAEQ